MRISVSKEKNKNAQKVTPDETYELSMVAFSLKIKNTAKFPLYVWHN